MNVRHDMISCFVVRPDAQGISHEFLQLRRVAGDYMGGTWQIVRGGVKRGERAWEAALRELREEAGLVPDEFYRLTAIEVFYTPIDDTIWHCPAFCAVVSRSADVRLNAEHDAHRWIARPQIADQTMWESERSALTDLFRNVLDDGPAKPFIRMQLAARNAQ